MCVLHDAPQTRWILEQLKAPAAYWCHERPVVLPCGDLDESDFVPEQETAGALHAYEDPMLADVPDTPTKMVQPHYDLTHTDDMGL